MELSTIFKRQLGLVHQDRIEDEKIFITGNGAIIPNLVTDLCLLGAGTSQGMITIPDNLVVTMKETRGQHLLLPEDEGLPLWQAIKNRVAQRFSGSIQVNTTNDANMVQWDSVFIAQMGPKSESFIVPKGSCPIYAITSKSAVYVGSKEVNVAPFEWNILTPSLSTIAAGVAIQEMLRRRDLIKPSEFLASNAEIKYVIQHHDIYNKCLDFSKKHKGLPYAIRVKLSGESIPATFEPVYEDVQTFNEGKEKAERRINPNRVIIHCTFPEDSYLTRMVSNLIEVLDEDNLDQRKIKDAFLFSPFKDARTENGMIVDSLIEIPAVLENKKVFFLGIGGLGSWVSLIFALSNTRNCHLTIDDLDDRVEEHNLNRQILFDRTSIGIPKVKAAKKELESLNPSNKVTALHFQLEIGTANSLLKREFTTYETYEESKNHPNLIPGTNIPSNILGEETVIANEIKDSDLLVVGPDNIRTRYICSLIGKLANIPVVNAGSEQFEGKVDLFLPGGDCYVCRYGEKSKYEEKVVSCTGTIPIPSIVTTISTIAGMQAALALAYLSNPKKSDALHHFIQYYGRYQMLASCQTEKCPHKQKPDCPKHMNLRENENPFKFF